MTRNRASAGSGTSPASIGLVDRCCLVGLIGVIVVLFGVGLRAGTAVAHAGVLDVQPANGGLIDELPATVVVTFTEQVSLTGGSARVLDDQGTVVSGEPSVDGADVVIPVMGVSGSGTFTVSFEVISADSHRISGATVFHVGAPTQVVPAEPADGGSGTSTRWLSVASIVVGFVWYSATLLAVGLWWFAVAVARLDRRGSWTHNESFVDRIHEVTGRAAIVGMAVAVAGLPLRIARTSGGLSALADNEVLSDALRGPLFLAALVVTCGLIGLAVGGNAHGTLHRGDAESNRSSGAFAYAAGASGLIALTGFAAEGHTRSQRPLAAMVAFDVVHLAAAAVWLGGIAGLTLAFRSRRAGDSMRPLVVRFSAIALWAVAAVSAAGVAMAWVVLPSWDALTSTQYGWTLLAKIFLVGVVVTLGAYNRRLLVPKLRESGDAGASVDDGDGNSSGSGLRRVVAVELVLLFAVVGATAVLVTRSPNETAIAAPPAGSTGPIELELELTGDAGTARLTVDPGTIGVNTARIELTDPDGTPIAPISPPTVELVESDVGLGPLVNESTGDSTGAGVYTAEIDAPLTGDWEVTVRVRLDRFTEVRGTGTFVID